MTEKDDKKDTNYETVYKKADMSVFEEFYFQKEQGDITFGSEGVALLQSAVGTGIGILCSRRDANGAPLYGYDTITGVHDKGEKKAKARCNIDVDGETYDVKNCYYYVKNAYGDAVYHAINADYEGDKKDGDMKVTSIGVTASSYRGDGYTKALEVAERAKWAKAKSILNESLAWIEGEFGACGLIDPFIKKSLLSQRAELQDAKKVVLKANELAIELTEKLRRELEIEKQKNKGE